MSPARSLCHHKVSNSHVVTLWSVSYQPGIFGSRSPLIRSYDLVTESVNRLDE